jgi:hypothetical protein
MDPTISEDRMTEVLKMIRQAFREESMSHTWVFEKSKISMTEKDETRKVQCQIMLIIFLGIKGIV